MGLTDYAAKRRFATTPEPAPGTPATGHRLTFVVHKHAARRMHYDLRLELDGVLKSWAVPKGPSLEPGSRRLAVMVEDHPLAYRDFEGVIPEGNYGAGGVIIWDRGVYCHPRARDEEENVRLLREGLARGDLKFVLAGEKLQGEFALVKLRGDEKSWLLLAKKDLRPVHGEILVENRSVVSHKTLEELLAAGGESPLPGDRVTRIRRHEAAESGTQLPSGPMPHLVRPMLATLASKPFDHPDWLFELKWDGYRAVAEVRQDGVQLYSRNLLPLSDRFSPLVDSLAKLPFEVLLDGEIVMVDDQGRPDFESLQNYPARRGHLLYYVFDLLHFQGRDLTSLPLLRRKELLKQILPPSPRLRFSDHVRGEGTLFFQVARDKGLEGIMAKLAASPYLTGTRSKQWLKIKTLRTQEGVIAGFTAPRGGRRHFGTLVLGAYAGDELVPIGHAGGGFGERDLAEIRARLEPLVQEECPFAVRPKTTMPVTWVRPELVCEVVSHGWTADGVMRQPTFRRLREDKAPREVVCEGEKGEMP